MILAALSATAPPVQGYLAAAVGLAAIVEDLRRRHISNWTTFGALAAGLVYHTVADGWRGLGAALLGGVVGFSVFLIFYLLGGMGGGDIKLMAGFGALLGGVAVPMQAALFAAAVGGVLAALVLAAQAVRRRFYPASAGSRYIPYAPAIAAGAWMALLAQP